MKIKSGRYSIEITHPEKVLFGTSGITKQDLVEYYQKIAPFMLPYAEDRPISMQRFPDGITKEGFYQKDAGDYFPDWITRESIEKKEGGSVDYVVIDKPATLIYLANQGCITPHLWLSKIDKIENPDQIIFDLDPPKKFSFSMIQNVAQKVKVLLDTLELPSFYKLTGSRGAHIIIPLKRIHSYEQTRAFAHDIAKLLAKQFPDLITIELTKSKRKNRVFLDWLRNGFGATAVAPYAVRAYENAPVAMPVTWNELQSSGMHSQKYTIKNAFNRLGKVDDIWKDIHKNAVSLRDAEKKLDQIKKTIK